LRPAEFGKTGCQVAGPVILQLLVVFAGGEVFSRGRTPGGKGSAVRVAGGAFSGHLLFFPE